MLRIRFLQQDTLISVGDVFTEDVQFKTALNSSGEWSAKIPQFDANEVAPDVGDRIEIYDGTTLLFEGILQKIDEEYSDTPMLSIGGRDLFDLLGDFSADPLAYFENQNYLFVLGELLRYGGWRLGDVSTVPDKTTAITVDLRTKETLLAQFQDAVKAYPGMMYRYGGIVAGQPTVDVGAFAEDSYCQVLTHASQEDLERGATAILTSAERTTSLVRSSSEIVPIGGDIKDDTGTQRYLHLGDHLKNNLPLAVHAQYPIVEVSPDQVYAVINLDYGLIGGTISTKTTYVTPLYIGNDSGGGGWNRRWATRFIAYPGLFAGFTVLFYSTTSNTGSITAPVTWYLHQYNASTPTVPGAIIASGTLTPSADRTVDVTIENPTLELAHGYYFLSLGFIPTYGASTYYSLRGVAKGHTQIGAWSGDGGTTWTSDNNIFAMEFRTKAQDQITVNRLSKRFSQFTPQQNQNNTLLAAISAAAAALYNQSVSYLVQRPRENRSYALSTRGNLALLALGDSIYVNAQYNAGLPTIENETIPVEHTLQGTFVIQGKSVTVSDVGHVTTLDIAQTAVIDEADAQVSLYSTTGEVKTPAMGLTTRFLGATVQTYQYTIENVLPTGIGANGLSYYRYSWNYPLPPAGKGRPYLIASPYPTSGLLNVSVVQYPIYLSNTPLIIDVWVGLRGWEYSDSFQINIMVAWQ